jgi:methylglutaconyl-CoA hydratase
VFLLRQIGEKRTRELLLTGRLFEAEEARAMGLVTQIVAPDRLLETARHLAHSLIAFSPTSLSRTKRLLLRCNEKEIERDLQIAIEESANIRRTADFREGLSAFLEKREPKWSGE